MENLIKRLIAGGFVLCLIISIQTAGSGQQSAATSNKPVVPQLSMREVVRLSIDGQKLSSQDAENLEQKLLQEPNDLASRIMLIGYYVQNWKDQKARLGKRRHALWLIDNCAGSTVLESLAGVRLNKLSDSEGYEAGKQLWLKQLEAYKTDPVVLNNAIDFFIVSDRDTAEQLLKRGVTLEPKNPRWPYRLGHLYALGLQRAPEETRRKAAALAYGQYEQALKLTKDEDGNASLFSDLATAALEAGEIATAKNWANQLLNKAPASLQSWDGYAVHHAHIVLGRIALLSGNTAEAKEQLLAAGTTSGSPALNIFGPSMILAKELLAKGERETVVRYFQLCANFWTNHDKLQEWTVVVKAGGVPNFGANLVH